MSSCSTIGRMGVSSEAGMQSPFPTLEILVHRTNVQGTRRPRTAAYRTPTRRTPGRCEPTDRRGVTDRRGATGGRRLAGKLATLVASFALAACTTIVPNDGPLLTRVASKSEAKDDFVYGLIDLNAHSVRSLEHHTYYPLSTKFGLSKARPGVRLGVGDVLTVTIFEAGPDGIFSTTERKSVALQLSVQQNGRISVPFAGSVRARGRTVGEVRRSILGALRGRAVEPDAIVELSEVRSRAVAVNGAVNGAKAVPLPLGSERLLEVIAQAGGPSKEPYNTYVSISRGGHTRTALLQTLIDHPRENIFVKPSDSIYLTHDPRQFVALGAVKSDGRYPFNSRTLNLLEATAIAGGFEDTRSNPQAFFIFRYEYEHVFRHLLETHYVDHKTLWMILDNHEARDSKGRVPVVYRVDLSDPDNFFLAKRFPVRADDAIYVARKGAVDFTKIIRLLAEVRLATRLVTGVTN